MTSAPAIGFEYHPPRVLQRALAVLGVLAVCAVATSAASLWLKLLLVMMVAGLVWHAIRGVARTPVAAAGWGHDDTWTLHLTDRQDVPATLVSFRVLARYIILRLHTRTHGVQTLLLAPDNSDADTRRRLRMRLATIQPDQAMPRL